MPYLTMIYRPDDFEPQYLSRACDAVLGPHTEMARRSGFTFRMIPVNDVLPTCTDKPHLWWRGKDLLEERQCFQIDDFSWNAAAFDFLRAVRRTIEASDSILLNNTFQGPTYLGSDKLAIAHRANLLGIPVIPTLSVPFGRYSRVAVEAALQQIGNGPFIVKPRELGMGVGVLKIDTPEQLEASVDLIAQSGIGYVVQPFVPNDGDVRVYIANGRVITALHRRPGSGNYRANASQGGACAISPDIGCAAELSLKIVEDLQASYLMVDWLLTTNGPVLNEWGSGFGGLHPVPEGERHQIADAFLSAIAERFKREPLHEA